MPCCSTRLGRFSLECILMAHLGIWSRQDPWAPAVLEPLIVGLKQRASASRLSGSSSIGHRAGFFESNFLQKKDAVVWIGFMAFLTPPSNVFENTIQPLLFYVGLGRNSGVRLCGGWVVAGGYASDRGDLSGCWASAKWKPVGAVVNKATVRVDVLSRSFCVWGVPCRSLFCCCLSWTRCLVRFGLIGFSPLQPDGLLPGVTDIPG